LKVFFDEDVPRKLVRSLPQHDIPKIAAFVVADKPTLNLRVHKLEFFVTVDALKLSRFVPQW
jgi:hypothetical protein